MGYLKGAGVQFPPGASASFLPSSSKLVVRNTEENLDLADQIFSTFGAQTAEARLSSHPLIVAADASKAGF